MKQKGLMWQIRYDTLWARTNTKSPFVRIFTIRNAVAPGARRPTYFLTQVLHECTPFSQRFSWEKEIEEEIGPSDGFASIPEAMQFAEDLAAKKRSKK